MMAENEFARGKRTSPARLVLPPAWRFCRGYVLRGGFLDGVPGLIESYVSADYVRQTAILMWLLQHVHAGALPPPDGVPYWGRGTLAVSPAEPTSAGSRRRMAER